MAQSPKYPDLVQQCIKGASDKYGIDNYFRVPVVYIETCYPSNEDVPEGCAATRDLRTQLLQEKHRRLIGPSKPIDPDSPEYLKWKYETFPNLKPKEKKE